MADLSSLLGLDLSILYLFNVYLQNILFNFIMPLITLCGTHFFWVTLCFILYVFGDQRAKEAAFIALTALLIGYFISEFLKLVIARPRPYEVIPWVIHQSAAAGYSMPSGHTVAAFSGFTALAYKYNNLLLFISLAILVGFSRIYMGLHYPTDVIGGAVVGLLSFAIAIKVHERVQCFGLCKFDT